MLSAALALGTTCCVSAVQGWTPLQSAVSAGHDQLAQRLLELHADPNAANSGGRTALHYTVSRSSTAGLFASCMCPVTQEVHQKEVWLQRSQLGDALSGAAQ